MLPKIIGKIISSGEYILTAVETGQLTCWNKNGEQIFELDAGNNLTVLADNDPAEFYCATAGKENPIKLWDMRAQKCFWEAKNVSVTIICSAFFLTLLSFGNYWL